MRRPGTWRAAAAWIAPACALLLIVCGIQTTTANPPREYVVKAAFLYNFAQFVDWPADAFHHDPAAPLVLGTVGDDPFQGALDRAAAGKVIRGHRLVVRHFARLSDVRDCHLLFISNNNDGLQKLGEQLANAPCLTVGERDGFLESGGIIRFYLEDDKLRFEINVKAAERARLKLSAKLLKLARVFNE